MNKHTAESYGQALDNLPKELTFAIDEGFITDSEAVNFSKLTDEEQEAAIQYARWLMYYEERGDDSQVQNNANNLQSALSCEPNVESSQEHNAPTPLPGPQELVTQATKEESRATTEQVECQDKPIAHTNQEAALFLCLSTSDFLFLAGNLWSLKDSTEYEWSFEELFKVGKLRDVCDQAGRDYDDDAAVSAFADFIKGAPETISEAR